MTAEERQKVDIFIRWHLSYLGLVAVFFSLVYLTGLYRQFFFLKEKFIFLVLSPVSTAVFVTLSPWKGHFKAALKDLFHRLEGQGVFCVLGAGLFLFGFFVYSIFIWGLGALAPSLVYM
jgi:multisubunit Na+/H+ antiporter MnhG subunit